MTKDDCICMVIGWPDTWSKGVEPLFVAAHKYGIIKDLYFKVGHASMCLIHKETKKIEYFDFGRYTCAHKQGRARGMNTDPSLEITLKAKINDDGKVENVQEIVDYLFKIVRYTHGEGVIYFSLYDKMNYAKTMAFVNNIQEKGSVRYTTFLPASTNCSRFVCGAVMAGTSSFRDKMRLTFQPTYKASPIGTAIDVGYQSDIYRQENIDSPLENFKMTRWDNFKLLWNNTKGNLKGEKIFRPNLIDARERPSNVSEEAQWLGGLGEGNWVWIRPMETEDGEIVVRATSYYHDGEVNYDTIVSEKGNANHFSIRKSFEVTYDCSRLFVTVHQNNQKTRLYLIDDFESFSKQKSIKITSKAWT